jgi:hypothetical protein
MKIHGVDFDVPGSDGVFMGIVLVMSILLMLTVVGGFVSCALLNK